jgi:putative transposase
VLRFWTTGTVVLRLTVVLREDNVTHEIITRRHLPHWYVPGAAHFVTLRLAGALPREIIERLQARKELLLRGKRDAGISEPEHRYRVHKQLFAAYDQYLDQHRDICWLSDPRVAAIVRSSLYHLHGEKYVLLAYCIMRNHLHTLFLPLPCEETGKQANEIELGETDDARGPLAVVMHSLKSYTSHEANRLLGRSGPFWQHESYDHWVRDDDELERIVEYINLNPVRAGLAANAHEYVYGSCHDRYLTDGDLSGWLRLPLVG